MKKTKRKRAPARSQEPRTALGAGLITLDIIVQNQPGQRVAHAAGGTCGNVTAALAYLGWRTTPVGRLGDDAAGNAIRNEFTRLGVSRGELTKEDSLTSTRIVQFIVKRGPDVRHRFAFSCPTCGSPFARYRPPTLDQAETVLANHRAPDVFFFDRVSAAILAMAGEFRKRGALIYYEPSGIGRPKDFIKALSLAHVVKYSAQRMHGMLDVLEALDGSRVEIETKGSQGLRFRWLRNRLASPWRNQPAFKVLTLRDSAGAGDWRTAGLLYQLDWTNGREFEGLAEEELTSALMFGQALAALNCQHVGAMGSTVYLDSGSILRSALTVDSSGTTQAAQDLPPPRVSNQRRAVSCFTCLRD